MSTLFPSTPSDGGSAPFHVHLGEQHVVDEQLDLGMPVYLVINSLTHRHQLPTVTGGYTLFGPDCRPISRELSLGRTSFAAGGELYLAPTRAPWWVAAPSPASVVGGLGRPASRSIAPRRAFSPRAVATAVAAALILLLGIWLFWPQGSSEGAGPEEAAGIAPPSAPPIVPTVTLLPASPTLSASPTPDAAALIALNYDSGLEAYAAQDWPMATDLLRQVYERDSDYRGVAGPLAAAYYNWGAQLLGTTERAAALDKFSAALSIAPEHQLAREQQQLLALYLEALELHERGTLGEAAGKLEELRALQPDYLDAATRLYDIYIAYGELLEERGNTVDAGQIYGKAVKLPLADVAAATEALRRIAPPPTATPKPAPKKLRFKVANYDDASDCVSIRITGIVPSGWFFVVDGIGLQGRFDSGGNARACGLAPKQEVTITVLDGNGTRVAGGGGVPSKGSAIMVADWR